MRVKISWARERLGYFAYCGSEPIMVDFWSEMGFDVQGMMCRRTECEFRPTCHVVTGHTIRLQIFNYAQNDLSKTLNSLIDASISKVTFNSESYMPLSYICS